MASDLLTFRTRGISLTARIYLAVSAILLVATTYFAYSLYAQKRMSAIIGSLLDRHVVVMEATQQLKRTLQKDEATLFDYLVTMNQSRLQKNQELDQTTLQEIRNIRQLTRNPQALQDLDLLESAVHSYFYDGQRLIAYSKFAALPPHPNFLQLFGWAHSRPQKFQGLDFLSQESQTRLAQIDSLCDDLISITRHDLQNDRRQMHLMLQAGRREALATGCLLGVLLLLIAVGHTLSILRPLRALLQGVNRVEKGDLDFQIPVTREDEIGQLTRSFNRMTRTVHHQRQRLVHENTTDALTGLYNQRHFRLMLKQEAERAERMQTGFSLLMIDIDYFKKYNDTMGHEFGNQILKVIAGTVKSAVREIDTVARYGGDELAVILPGASPNQALALAKRIEASVYEHSMGEAGDTTINSLTLSIGGACFPRDAEDAEDLISKADQALYAAKHAGRACVRWYPQAPQEKAV